MKKIFTISIYICSLLLMGVLVFTGCAIQKDAGIETPSLITFDNELVGTIAFGDKSGTFAMKLIASISSSEFSALGSGAIHPVEGYIIYG